MNIIIFGPQASGKGTQAKKIAEKYGLTHISTGDIFRENVKNQTELGKTAEALINKGIFVPDKITNEMVQEKLIQEDCKNGFILDGYPRNQSQAEFLETLPHEIKFALNLEVSREISIERITGRRVCKPCKIEYNINVLAIKPKDDKLCDKCGGELFQRDDDKDSAAVEKRLQLYDDNTKPLLGFYEEKGLLININGNQDIDKVFEEIIQKIDS